VPDDTELSRRTRPTHLSPLAGRADGLGGASESRERDRGRCLNLNSFHSDRTRESLGDF